jgi:hypothetical protein
MEMFQPQFPTEEVGTEHRRPRRMHVQEQFRRSSKAASRAVGLRRRETSRRSLTKSHLTSPLFFSYVSFHELFDGRFVGNRVKQLAGKSRRVKGKLPVDNAG